ncbi:MAG TPA: SDR family NAD(P)-dependent oxidoreductase [Anaeromyxobacteraceae bacterium]|nr:SDR family NAD(P)-dependent oxidoreductase [Anaeromyxobacteraceae bacterium]
MNLSGASAIVTGGGRGIGAAVAAALTRAGARVTVFARTRGEVDAAVARGDAALAVAGDVSREDDVARLVAEHERALGPTGVLVNNAGILVRGLAEELSPAAWRAQLEVNLTGAWLCARAVIPGMKARRRGRIVNVGSISGTIGSERSSAYNASKWGLLGLTKCLAEELRAHGVQCLAVSPGSVDTAMLRQTPFTPAMTPADVARVVAWCAGEAPDAMTGAAVEVFG